MKEPLLFEAASCWIIAPISMPFGTCPISWKSLLGHMSELSSGVYCFFFWAALVASQGLNCQMLSLSKNVDASGIQSVG